MNLAEKWLSMICLKIEKISFTVGYSFYQFKHILPEIQMFYKDLIQIRSPGLQSVRHHTNSPPPNSPSLGANSPPAAIRLKRYV